MEKNPLQQTHQYPWEKINKIEIIPQCPNHTMVIDNGEGDRDIHHTWEKITEMTSNGFTTDRALTRYSDSDSDSDAEKSAGFRASV